MTARMQDSLAVSPASQPTKALVEEFQI